MNVSCPNCKSALELTGQKLMCRECGAELELQVKQSSAPESPRDEIDEDRNCPMCGQPAYKRDRECRNCGERLPASASASTLDGVLQPIPSNPDAVTPSLVRRFGKECTALGTAWFVLGALHFLLAFLLVRAQLDGSWWLLWGFALILINGVALIISGFATALRSLRAITVGRVLTVIVMIGCLAGAMYCFPIAVAALLISPLRQANRLLGWGGRIEGAGYPLTIDPIEVIETVV